MVCKGRLLLVISGRETASVRARHLRVCVEARSLVRVMLPAAWVREGWSLCIVGAESSLDKEVEVLLTVQIQGRGYTEAHMSRGKLLVYIPFVWGQGWVVGDEW